MKKGIAICMFGAALLALITSGGNAATACLFAAASLLLIANGGNTEVSSSQ